MRRRLREGKYRAGVKIRRSVRFHRPSTSSGPTVAQLHHLSSVLNEDKPAFILAPSLKLMNP